MRAVLGPTLLAAALGVVVSTSTSAQNTYQQQITRQLTNAANILTPRGYTADRAPVMGNLNASNQESVLMNLNAGVQYAILGVCDNDCRDVDLRVYDPLGNSVGEDVATDDTPVVEFVASTSGQYRVTVIMAACNQNPCYYGVQVFLRSGK
jgi:hypothetical protein